MRAALVGLCLLVACQSEPAKTSTASSPITTAWPYLNFVAHEDDDTLFMNPDLMNWIGAGVGTVTVVMTAGEAGGTVDGATPVESRWCFAASRQEGMRRAYASMAGVPSTWTMSLASYGGVQVPVWTLQGAPVKLIFLNLLDGGDTPSYTLTNLYDDRCTAGSSSCVSRSTLQAAHVPDANGYCTYDFSVPAFNATRANVLAIVQGILAAYQPSVVRELDPHPYARCLAAGFSFDDGIQQYVHVSPPDCLGCNHNGICNRMYSSQGAPIDTTTVDETSASCPSDCPPAPTPACGDGVCGAGETWQNCGADCGERRQTPVTAVDIDNADHVVTTRFVDEALQTYHGPSGSARYSNLYYRAYSIENNAGNLGASEYQRKHDTFWTYVQSADDTGTTRNWDPNTAYFYPGQQAQPIVSGYPAWVGATYERYPANTTWLTLLANGTLGAFGVQDRQLVSWNETSPGVWSGPIALGGGPLAPHVALTQSTAGTLTAFALQLPVTQGLEDPTPLTPKQSVMYIQRASTGAWSSWTSLGNPDANPPNTSICEETAYGYPVPARVGNFNNTSYAIFPCRTLGEPVAAIDGTGATVVFVKNSYGKISRDVQLGGVFQGWSPLPEPTSAQYDVLEGLAAITANDGRVHLFASTYGGQVFHWYQNAPGQNAFTADPPFPLGNPITNAASAPTVTKNQDGRLEIFYRAESTADVITAFQTTSGTWSTNLVDLGNTTTGGIGPITAMLHTATGRIMLFARNGFGGISMTYQGSPNSSFTGTWTDLQSQFPAYPSATTDASGLHVVAAQGFDGVLYIRRERLSRFGPIFGSFGAWTAVGN